MHIRQNKDKKIVDKVKKALKANDGYCPCRFEKTPDTKCMCQEFINSKTIGLCHCGLYEKVSAD